MHGAAWRWARVENRTKSPRKKARSAIYLWVVLLAAVMSAAGGAFSFVPRGLAMWPILSIFNNNDAMQNAANANPSDLFLYCRFRVIKKKI